MRNFCKALLACAALAVGLALGTEHGTRAAYPDRLSRLQHFHDAGQICDDCAADSFAAYIPCTTPDERGRACKWCDHERPELVCCPVQGKDCCCRHRAENCRKLCKKPV